MAVLKTIRGEDRGVAMVRVDALTWADGDVTHYEVEIVPRVPSCFRLFEIMTDVQAVDEYIEHKIKWLEVMQLLVDVTVDVGDYDYIPAIDQGSYETLADTLIKYFENKQ